MYAFLPGWTRELIQWSARDCNSFLVMATRTTWYLAQWSAVFPNAFPKYERMVTPLLGVNNSRWQSSGCFVFPLHWWSTNMNLKEGNQVYFSCQQSTVDRPSVNSQYDVSWQSTDSRAIDYRSTGGNHSVGGLKVHLIQKMKLCTGVWLCSLSLLCSHPKKTAPWFDSWVCLIFLWQKVQARISVLSWTC